MTDFNKKIIAIVIGFIVFNISLYVFSIIITEKVANRVIEKLSKPYTPVVPENFPLLDPDKIDPDDQPKPKKVQLQYNWENEWEMERTNP